MGRMSRIGLHIFAHAPPDDYMCSRDCVRTMPSLCSVLQAGLLLAFSNRVHVMPSAIMQLCTQCFFYHRLSLQARLSPLCPRECLAGAGVMQQRGGPYLRQNKVWKQTRKGREEAMPQRCACPIHAAAAAAAGLLLTHARLLLLKATHTSSCCV